jgi:hypothetical protein
MVVWLGVEEVRGGDRFDRGMSCCVISSRRSRAGKAFVVGQWLYGWVSRRFVVAVVLIVG